MNTKINATTLLVFFHNRMGSVFRGRGLKLGFAHLISQNWQAPNPKT